MYICAAAKFYFKDLFDAAIIPGWLITKATSTEIDTHAYTASIISLFNVCMHMHI